MPCDHRELYPDGHEQGDDVVKEVAIRPPSTSSANARRWPLHGPCHSCFMTIASYTRMIMSKAMIWQKRLPERCKKPSGVGCVGRLDILTLRFSGFQQNHLRVPVLLFVMEPVTVQDIMFH